MGGKEKEEQVQESKTPYAYLELQIPYKRKGRKGNNACLKLQIPYKRKGQGEATVGG